MQFAKEKEAAKSLCGTQTTCQAGLLKLGGPEYDANPPHGRSINRSRPQNIVRPSLWEVWSRDFIFPLEFLLSEPGSDPGIWWSGDLSDQ